MNEQLKETISKELEQFYCSILLNEVKENVRKLKAYGVGNEEIDAVLYDEEIFPSLKVTQDFRILLCREKKEEIKMEPLIKAVYLLFLRHPEGIVLKCLPDYQEELIVFYSRLRPYEPTSRVRKSIRDVTDPTLNSINEKCTRIRKTFLNYLPKQIAKYYCITGNRGEAKRIMLPRDLITWEEEI